MFGFSSENADIPCPECRRILVEVAPFGRALGLDTRLSNDQVDDDPFDLFVWGYGGRGDGVFFLFRFFNGLIDGTLGWFHKQKARRICRQLLQEAPKSLICASCLYVHRRK